jgi:ATP-dependent DNA helicase RecG
VSPGGENLLARGESETCEFEGPQATVSDVARDICALLNQQGGAVLWGVTDAKRVVGLVSAGERQKELNEYVAQHIKPRPLLSISVEEIAARQIVLVDVPPGADKPYALDREIWIRVARQTLRASGAASSELVGRSASEFERWERELMPGFAISDCDAEELHRARLDLVRTERFGAGLPESDDEFLGSLNLARGGQITNGCVVLFARRPREWAPHLALRITSYSDLHGSGIGPDTILEGPAVKVVQDAIAIIQQRTGFAGEFRRTSLQREDRPAYPLFALREGLVNAVVHRDYSGLGDVRVQIYPDLLVIRNPGSLPDGWTVRELRTEHVSKPTNPDIARLFYLRGLMEQLGMGTQKLIAECKAAGAKTPMWTAEKGLVSLRMFRSPATMSLAPRQARFISLKKSGSDFVLHDYARSAKVSERQARRDLQELERLGLIERHGRGPATSYRLRTPDEEDFDRARDAAVRRYREEAPTKDRDAIKSVDAMVSWFFERYEDPANGVPYDGREGGYQYVAGGPYEAEEELREAFEDGSSKIDRLIRAAVKRIEDSGYQWVKRGEY